MKTKTYTNNSTLTKPLQRVAIVLLALIGVSNLAYAGDRGSSIREAASKLDHAASEFYQRAHYSYGRSDLSYEAKSLAKATHRFCAKVERGVPFRRLWREFDQLQSRYEQAHYQLKYARENHAYGAFSRDYSHRGRGLGFKRVRKWFERLDRAMYREHQRYGKRHSRQRNDAHDYAFSNQRRDRRRNRDW